MNRNLHSPTTLTEFAREFDEEPETMFSKFVNKITNAYYNNGNSANVPHTPVASDMKKENKENFQGPSKSMGLSQITENESCLSNWDEKSDSPPSCSDNISTVSSDDPPVDLSINISQGRTPINVLRRISNLVSQKSQNSRNYRNTDLQKFWMPDSTSIECYECSQKFSTFRRKHHCRLCGQIFCTKCCNQVVTGKIINCSGDLKVCTYCSKIVLSYLKSSNIAADLKSDLQALQEDLSSKLSVSQNPSQTPNDAHSSAPSRRKISVGYQEERFVSNTNNGLSNADRKNILQQSNSLKTLYEDMSKTLLNQNRGLDLISFLFTNQKSSNKIQAVAILNAMIDAGFLIPLTPTVQAISYPVESESDEIVSIVEFDEQTVYKLLKQDETMSHSGSFQLDLDFEASSVHLTRPLPEDSSSLDDIVPPSAPDSFSFYSNVRDIELENSLFSSSGAKPLLETFCEHEELLLSQLLRSENLDISWSKILIPICARVANTLRPESCGTDAMDIRSYVNFKKVSGGTRKECKILGGIVFSKNVAHKQMATMIEKPKVLLLQCAVAYQRVEGKFVSFDTLMLQEREYLRNVITKILSLEPNIVLVHKNVAGIAQDLLRENGVTLVLDVKLSVLERLSRCLECDILTSIDSNVGRPKLGTCDLFYIKSFNDDQEIPKTLMCFEIAYSPRGCCILLRGGNNSELARIKKVAMFLLFARYNWRLELSYLCDEFASPPSPKPNIFESKEQSPLEELKDEEDPNTITITLKKSEDFIKIKEKTVNIENVRDFSDPLRATDLSPSVFDSESSFEFAVETPYDNRFRTALSSTVLSVSPFIAFPLPYLETEYGRKCALRLHFPNELYYSKQWSFNNHERQLSQELCPMEEDSIIILPLHEFTGYNMVASIDNKEVQTLVSNFRASGGRFQKKDKMKKIEKRNVHQCLHFQQKSIEEFVYKDALDLENHQRISVLFCSYYCNIKAPSSFCAQPSLLNMQFYGQNDIMLGLFLERYCFRSSYICKSCNLPMMDHIRRYVHSLGCIQVKLSEDPNKVDTGTILMTSMCTICNETTKSAPMSNDTWCFSFAKYLELRFHGHLYKRRQVDDTNYCDHSLHKDHIQYFSFKGIVASIMYTPVEIWEISLPSMIVQLKLSRNNGHGHIVEDIKILAMLGYNIYAQIYDCLAAFSSEIEDALITKLKEIVNRDLITFKQRVEVVQTLLTEKSIPSCDIGDAMLLVKKALAESIEVWEPKLHEIQHEIGNHNKSLSHKNEIPPLAAVDNATICTEDLNMAPDENSDGASCTSIPNLLEANVSSVSKQEYEHISPIDGGVITSDDLKSELSEIVFQPDKGGKESLDKKRVITLLSQLLPSSGTTHILQSPFPINEHHTLKCGLFPILVNDQDLSSCIAYGLASSDYRKILENLYSGKVIETNNSPSLKRKSQDVGTLSETEDKEVTAKSEIEKPKTKSSSHIEVHYQDASTQFTCKVYFAKEFDNMRCNFMQYPVVECNSKSSSKDNKDETFARIKADDIRKTFVRSLCRSVQWEARGGKSGSKFSKTIDDRFVIKEMNRQDVAIFENFAPNYFEYIEQCLVQKQPTLLAKIFGVFKMTIRKKDSSVSEQSVLVMENLFCDRDISNKFDLKGSDRNRLVDPNRQTGEIVLMDENLIQMSWKKPLYILTHSRTILKEAINRDSSFLEKNSVMDYSLLVGLESDEKLLVLGIIDYIRTYTLDKRVESLFKKSGFLGGNGKLPTVVSPKMYKNRFSDAMDRYFLAVPDRWEGLSKK